MIRRFIKLQRFTPLKKKRAKSRRRPGHDNPKYRAWLRTLPCWVCFRRYCKKGGWDVYEEIKRQDVRSLFCALQAFDCGLTEAAHVGLRGMWQRCKDSEALPFGTRHHMHATMGGNMESHHSLGKSFWEYHKIDRDGDVQMFNCLYQEETGRKA